MPKEITLRLLPAEVADDAIVRRYVAAACGKPVELLTGYYILKQSLDARGRTIWVNLQVLAFINEPPQSRLLEIPVWKEVPQDAPRLIIIGAGPAGLFAALRCLELGIKPIVLERGKDVRARRRDLAAMNKQGEVNPESNYCYGEGGAGTYSDGKLYTRSSKRGSIQRILTIFHHFGADERILYEAHPHIGTNKLPHIITAMRQQILALGGEIHFGQKVTGLRLEGSRLRAVETANGNLWEGKAFVLATGHSARDIFTLLYKQGVGIESKPFALGVRIEHPQQLIDECQYHLQAGPPLQPHATYAPRGPWLPPASYNLVQQVDNRGVFSFCMCPGGIIAPAATTPGEMVVNGWSPSKRNNPFANSGMVVEVKQSDLIPPKDWNQIMEVPASALQSPLGMMYFQQYIERKAWHAGGGMLQAPAQRVEDFIQRRHSAQLPACSYLPGIVPADLYGVLPGFVSHTLRGGLIAFGKKMKGYRTNDAVLVATESRTSSPVRIPRLADRMHHPQITNLYPCAEGAGYAGGIVSAAMDGEKIVQALAVIF